MAVNIPAFITRWSASGGSEQANSQMFLTELCDILEVERPEPAKPVNEDNVYSFERKVYVPGANGGKTPKRLDLYRRKCFVLESKQGQDSDEALQATLPGTHSAAVKRGTRPWEETMTRARRQAENYVRSLPANEGRPPFIIVCDVGYCFDIFAEFSCSGGLYLPFPDNQRKRIMLADLEQDAVRHLLQAIWNDPLSLDPARHAAQVTEEIAGHLARLAMRLENEGHHPEAVSAFLMRCIFTMFAEDVGLIPQGCFTSFLEDSLADPEPFAQFLTDIWKAMNDGSLSTYLRQRLKRFNGNLFANPAVLPLDKGSIAILLEAAQADWREVEPAIFGTLLERALEPRERHKLGAHYTPRAYVERLVLPTIIEPLRSEWENVQAVASHHDAAGDRAKALKAVDSFHERLCTLRVLDPACGSGNFLYVTLEHLKRLESEVLAASASYGGSYKMDMQGLMVDPHQFLGLEVNPRAAHIAEMVLWIGYLQWHFRTHGTVSPPEPIIRRFDNIQCRDAVLDWDDIRPALNSDGTPRTRWDGVTYKCDPVTGRDVPDAAAQVADVEYVNPRPATWPEADFIVGNPPFVGGGVKRRALGDGYMEALCSTYADLPEACDFVMYWWHKAAEIVRRGKARRFGFISTNTITQVFNRRITAAALGGKDALHLDFAVPDHPWVDAADGAAVRIAMTVASQGAGKGRLARVLGEHESGSRERLVRLATAHGTINADLSVGVDVTRAQPLQADVGIAIRGILLVGDGFLVTPEEAKGLGRDSIVGLEKHIRPYRNGKDITGKCRNVMVIDLQGLSAEQVKERYPAVYQWVLERVKPERDVNKEEYRRVNWWVFGRKHTDLRNALANLPRYIATPMTAKHRIFLFLENEILPDQGLVAIASSDAYHLGVLQSHIHICWALAAGGTLEDRPRYNNTVCFAQFPFPAATEQQKQQIRDVAEKLDAHRKQRQAEHPDVTLTNMYNVLAALREGRPLTAKERIINDKALVSVLKQYHDELDVLVAEAYGWPADADEQDILARIVKLNAERVAEEQAGHIRWLRPEYQAQGVAATATQATMTMESGSKASGKAAKRPWPKLMEEQFIAVRKAISNIESEITAENVAKVFSRANRTQIAAILCTLRRIGLWAA